MAGIPAYPADWASELSDIRQRLNAAAASAQTRVGYTGGALPGALSVGQALTAAGGLGVTGAAAISGAVTAGSAAVAGAVSAGSANITGALTADDLIGDTLTIGGVTINLAELLLALDPPRGDYAKGGGQTVPNATLTGVTGMVFNAPAAGWYAATGSISWNNDTLGRREAGLSIQGGGYWRSSSQHSSRNTLLTSPVSGEVALNAGQNLEIAVYQDTGAGLGIASGWLTVHRTGPL